MKFPKKIILFYALLFAVALQSQSEVSKIQSLRQASNLALKAYDTEQVLSFLTEDVLTTTGAGTLLSGKDALRRYIDDAPDSKMYWVRTPSEIVVNEPSNLAWETGSWKGYNPAVGSDPVIGGRYSAQWTRKSGVWKIASQLFVTLE
ncbi:MAG: nuclear transport factor 2 family protein [Robiginitalea sp.]|uniref:YybH family protein n=1 Tax=Robiginitalea sp. TaxID=1902411 RepID=UPI003C78E33B